MELRWVKYCLTQGEPGMLLGETWGSRILSQPKPIEFNDSLAPKSSLGGGGVGEHPTAREIPSRPSQPALA